MIIWQRGFLSDECSTSDVVVAVFLLPQLSIFDIQCAKKNNFKNNNNNKICK